jgi:hypothetical protein
MVNKKEIKLYLPSWVSSLYTLFAIAMVPWTIYLAYSLPQRHIDRHWDVSWVGLDIGIILLLLLTGFLASIKSRLVILSLSATASFLVVDAWFDIVSSRPGQQFFQAFVLAIIIEIPLAILGFYLAYRTINRNVD